MKRATARAASLRGCTNNTRWGGGTSPEFSKAGGTRVVLPDPGGAVSTRASPPPRHRTSSGSSASTGRLACSVAKLELLERQLQHQTRAVRGSPGLHILRSGRPILELARNLLVLSGYDPVDDGPGIEIVGARPGEKLHESLLDPGEILEASENALIHKARCRVGDPTEAAACLPDLLAMARRGDRGGLRQALATLLERPQLVEPPAAGGEE